MGRLLCVTNRKLCAEDFLVRTEKIARSLPGAVILREKDLPEEAYREFARKVMEICQRNGTLCILHSFADAAAALGAQAVHLPLPALRKMSGADKARFRVIGASCHSVEDAREAQEAGCSYITAGHVFATDCKKGLPPRGLAFLREVCESVSIPVYAIGGIGGANYSSVIRAGAAGACVMSGLMRCEDVEAYIKTFGI